MEKEFVTYEIALKLKELGFDEECLAFITPMKNWMITNHKGEPSAFLKHDVGNHMYIKTVSDPFGDNLGRTDKYVRNSKFTKAKKNIALPLWQQALDYLREKFLVHVSITMVVTTYGLHEFAGQEVLWRYGRYMVNTKNDVRDKDDLERYKTYYAALEAGILDAIELIINQ